MKVATGNVNNKYSHGIAILVDFIRFHYFFQLKSLTETNKEFEVKPIIADRNNYSQNAWTKMTINEKFRWKNVGRFIR